MDVAGTVVDTGSSEYFANGDCALAPGTVENSDGCSYQMHVLVDRKHCAKVRKTEHKALEAEVVLRR
jgi:hypothetical protein